MELRDNSSRKSRRDRAAREQQVFMAEREGTSANEPPSAGQFDSADATSNMQENQGSSTVNTNPIVDIYKESNDDYGDSIPSGFNDVRDLPSTNFNIRDTDRITALEHQAKRTETKLASLS